MLKYLIFVFIVSRGFFSVVRSNPHKRSIVPDTESNLKNEEFLLGKNNTNSSCLCSINATSFGSILKPQNFDNIQNVLLSAPNGPLAFVWRCNFVPNKVIRDDYRYTPGIGSHKLHTRAKVWNEARKICIEEGGHLAIINSQAEAHVLLDLFNKSGPFKGAVYQNQILLGIHDLYSEGEWVTLQGDSLAKTGYNTWSDKWGGQPDNGGGIQNCGAMMDDGKLDDVACNVPFAFFCEIPDV